MKVITMRTLLGSISCLAVSSLAFVEAKPYYVGNNPTPDNSIFLDISDAMTKETGGIDQGNIAAAELKGSFQFFPNLSFVAGLPFYYATKEAVQLGANPAATDAETALGNASFGFNYSRVVNPNDPVFRWGYALSAQVYAPTSREEAGSAVASITPALSYFDYAPTAFSAVPKASVFGSGDYYSLKADLGYGYTNIGKTSLAGGDKNRNNFLWQTAASYHPSENVNLNLEYNGIMLDTRVATGNERETRHTITPSVSGEWGQMVGAFYVHVPVDSDTRDYTPLAVGLNAGYNF